MQAFLNEYSFVKLRETGVWIAYSVLLFKGIYFGGGTEL